MGKRHAGQYANFGWLRYNALLVVSLPIIIGLFYVESIRSKYPKLYIKVHRPLFIWIYFFIVIAWWLCRNWMGW